MGEHHAHEQAAIATTLSAEARRRGESTGDQVPGHRGEVLVDQMAVVLERVGMPARSVLAAAPDVGADVAPAAGQPGPTEGTAVVRLQGYLEAAVAVEQGGPTTGRCRRVGH